MSSAICLDSHKFNYIVLDHAFLLSGLVGFFPVHPRSYIQAWRNRRELEAAKQEAEKEEVKS